MNARPELTEEEVRDVFAALDDVERPLPPGFADRLWAELGVNDAGPDPAEAEIVLLDDVTPTPSTSAPAGPSDRGRALLAAAAAVVVVAGGVGLLALLDRAESTRVAADGAAETAEESPEPAEPGFAEPATVYDVGLETASVGFSSSTRSAYNVLLQRGSDVVSTLSGTVEAGERFETTFDTLSPATDYQIAVTLIGSTTHQSGLLPFRTLADPDDPRSFDRPIAVADLTAVEGGFTIESNLCATAAYAVLDPVDQSQLARLEPDTGCSTDHRFRLDEVAADLGTSDHVLVVVELEEQADGRPTGNVTATSVRVELGGGS